MNQTSIVAFINRQWQILSFYSLLTRHGVSTAGEDGWFCPTSHDVIDFERFLEMEIVSKAKHDFLKSLHFSFTSPFHLFI